MNVDLSKLAGQLPALLNLAGSLLICAGLLAVFGLINSPFNVSPMELAVCGFLLKHV